MKSARMKTHFHNCLGRKPACSRSRVVNMPWDEGAARSAEGHCLCECSSSKSPKRTCVCWEKKKTNPQTIHNDLHFLVSCPNYLENERRIRGIKSVE